MQYPGNCDFATSPLSWIRREGELILNVRDCIAQHRHDLPRVERGGPTDVLERDADRNVTSHGGRIGEGDGVQLDAVSPVPKDVVPIASAVDIWGSLPQIDDFASEGWIEVRPVLAREA